MEREKNPNSMDLNKSQISTYLHGFNCHHGDFDSSLNSYSIVGCMYEFTDRDF